MVLKLCWIARSFGSSSAQSFVGDLTNIAKTFPLATVIVDKYWAVCKAHTVSYADRPCRIWPMCIPRLSLINLNSPFRGSAICMAYNTVFFHSVSNFNQIGALVLYFGSLLGYRIIYEACAELAAQKLGSAIREHVSAVPVSRSRHRSTWILRAPAPQSSCW